MGTENEEDEGKDGSEGTEKKEKSYTQKDVDRIVRGASNKAGRSAVKALLDELGFDSADELKDAFDRIGSDAGSRAEHVKEDDPPLGLMRLLQRKRHQPIQVAEVGCDEYDRGTGPAAWSPIRHDCHLYAKRFAPETAPGCAVAHGDL